MTRRAACLLIVSVALAPGIAAAQVDGAWLDYHDERRFDGVSGAYAGWGDELVASGHYTVAIPAAPDPSTVQVHGTYQWRYTSPESRDSGRQDRTVDVDRATRRYASATTDLDEYDGREASSLATWLFVPPTLAVDQTISILDEPFAVVEREAPITIAGAARSAIHLRREGSGERHDAYGDFTTRSEDEYWFDAATGMFLRELRTETDVGTTNGERATLQVREEVRVVDASYAPRVGEPEPDPMLSRPRIDTVNGTWLHYAIPLGAGGVLALFLLLRSMIRPRAAVLLRGEPIVVEKLGAKDGLDAIRPTISILFGPFLAHFVDIARRTGNDVWVARVGSTVEGLALDDRDARVATIFAREPDVCEALRRRVGRQDFFSELRHGNLASVVDAAQTTSEKLPASTAYNVLETYEVLQLSSPASPTYDTQVVTRLDEASIIEAAALLEKVLGVPCRSYLEASLAAGDIGYVARASGAIVGVGLATVVGTMGRMHTLAVDPAHRNKGLGRELVRARVRAMAALGAETILTEISAANSPSLELARGEGFVPVGHVYVETAREAAPSPPPKTVRR